MTITADTVRDISRDLGARLRAVRNGLGLSLSDVEYQSGGQWPAVVIGSWERADRQISVPKLLALSEFYGVDPGSLLTAAGAASAIARLDLPAIADKLRSVADGLDAAAGGA